MCGHIATQIRNHREVREWKTRGDIKRAMMEWWTTRDWGTHSPGILFLIMVNKSPVTMAIIRLKPPGAALQQNSEERDRRENVAGLICHCHPNLTPLYRFSSQRLKESRYIGRQVWVPPITMLALFPARIGEALPAATPTQQLNKPSVRRFSTCCNLAEAFLPKSMGFQRSWCWRLRCARW